MVPTYTEYIEKFVRGAKWHAAYPTPGEHHFVGSYLVPKLFSLTGTVPDYINPDGTKAILGDVVYFKDGAHHLGIEVKLGTVRLTANEFNNWIVRSGSERRPQLFVGVGKSGLALTTWSEFREGYEAAVRSKNPQWRPKRINVGYGPSKSVDELMKFIPSRSKFMALDHADTERRFESALREHLLSLISLSRAAA